MNKSCSGKKLPHLKWGPPCYVSEDSLCWHVLVQGQWQNDFRPGIPPRQSLLVVLHRRLLGRVFPFIVPLFLLLILLRLLLYLKESNAVGRNTSYPFLPWVWDAVGRPRHRSWHLLSSYLVLLKYICVTLRVMTTDRSTPCPLFLAHERKRNRAVKGWCK